MYIKEILSDNRTKISFERKDSENSDDLDAQIKSICQILDLDAYNFPARYAHKFEMIVTRRPLFVEAVIVSQTRFSERKRSEGIVQVLIVKNNRLTYTDILNSPSEVDQYFEIAKNVSPDKMKMQKDAIESAIETLFELWYSEQSAKLYTY